MSSSTTSDDARSTEADAQPTAASNQSSTSMGTLGMTLLIASLSVLFAASLMGYVVVRARAMAWPPPGAPGLPVGLWVSTIVLVISSGTMHGALYSVRRDRLGALVGLLMITTLLGVCFLVSQVINWAWLIAITSDVKVGLYLFTFYMLTGLHAAHVIGGLILLTVITARSFGGRYSSRYHPGVTYASMYWHFLDVVWLVMFTAMFLV